MATEKDTLESDDLSPGARARWASGHEPVWTRIDPSEDLHWFYPAQVIRKLDFLLRECGIDLSRPPGKPLPLRLEFEILERLVPAVILREPATGITARYGRLSRRDRRCFERLILSARAAAQQEQALRPATLLGFPRDTHGTWANILGASWFPMPENWIAAPHD